MPWKMLIFLHWNYFCLYLRLQSFNFFVSLLRSFFIFFSFLSAGCLGSAFLGIISVWFWFFYFCLLILGGEHIEGIDFSTTIFGCFPMKNPMKNSFTHREFRECFWSVFLRFFFTSGAIFFLDFSSFFSSDYSHGFYLIWHLERKFLVVFLTNIQKPKISLKEMKSVAQKISKILE